jgi:hypothetical protein
MGINAHAFSHWVKAFEEEDEASTTLAKFSWDTRGINLVKPKDL